MLIKITDKRKFWTWVIGIAAAVLLILVLLFVFRKVDLPGKSILEDHLYKQIDSFRKEEKQAKVRSETLQHISDSLKARIFKLETSKRTVKEYYERTIPYYDSYSPDQIERYLSNRANSKD